MPYNGVTSTFDKDLSLLDSLIDKQRVNLTSFSCIIKNLYQLSLLVVLSIEGVPASKH